MWWRLVIENMSPRVIGTQGWQNEVDGLALTGFDRKGIVRSEEVHIELGRG
jgi:hypothetical protein